MRYAAAMTFGDILLIFGTIFVVFIGLLADRRPYRHPGKGAVGFDSPAIDTDGDSPTPSFVYDSGSYGGRDVSAGFCGSDAGGSTAGSVDTGSCSPN